MEDLSQEKWTKIDKKILKILQQDATLSVAEVANQVGLSQSPCWRRINRLEQAGLIRRRVALLDAPKLSLGVLVFFVSLMSTLVPPTVSLAVKGLAAAMLFVLSLLWFSLLAWWLSSAAVAQRLARAGRYIDALCGALFSLLGGGIVIGNL